MASLSPKRPSCSSHAQSTSPASAACHVRTERSRAAEHLCDQHAAGTEHAPRLAEHLDPSLSAGEVIEVAKRQDDVGEVIRVREGARVGDGDVRKGCRASELSGSGVIDQFGHDIGEVDLVATSGECERVTAVATVGISGNWSSLSSCAFPSQLSPVISSRVCISMPNEGVSRALEPVQGPSP